MGKFEIVVKIDMPAEEYWKLLDDPEFEQFQFNVLEFKQFEEIELDVNGVLNTRTTKVFPKVSLPGPVYNMVLVALGKEDLSYTDHTYKQVGQPGVYQGTFWSQPPIFADVLKIHGKLYLKPDGPNSCQHCLEGEATMNSWGVAEIIERVIVSNIKYSIEQMAVVVKRWKERQEKKAAGQVVDTEFTNPCKIIRFAEYQQLQAKGLEEHHGKNLSELTEAEKQQMEKDLAAAKAQAPKAAEGGGWGSWFGWS